MKRVTRNVTLRSRSDGSLRRERQPVVHPADGTFATAGVAMLAPAFSQGLPALDSVPSAYSHELGAELLYDLGAVLVREGLAGPETWEKCEGSSIVFVRRTIMENTCERRWNFLRRNVEFHLSVSDVAERDGEDVPLGNLA
jgi:hypothetical protein